jgi:alcohol dehydrogenase class IV
MSPLPAVAFQKTVVTSTAVSEKKKNSFNNTSRRKMSLVPKASLTTSTSGATPAATTKPFEFTTASRTVFEIDAFETRTVQLIEDLAKQESADIDAKPVLIVCGESNRFSSVLQKALKEEANIESVIFNCPKGEPTVQSAIDCTKLASENGCELVVAVGGGTAVDTGKCVAAMLTNGGAERDIYDFLEVVGKAMPIEKRPRPFVAIPTTAGPGAELTKNSVLEAGDRKVSMRHPLMLPDLVIVDPKLTVQMPRDVTAHTGLDALTQCIEPYVCNSPNPVTDSLSMSGIKLGAKSLRRCLEQPDDISARTDMALCAMYGGMALANAKLGAVHGFSGTLGGLLHAPHGAICAALLPHCVKMNVELLETRVMDENPERAKEGLRRYKEVANACLGKDDATVAELVKWIEDLVSFCGVPKLSKFGMKDEDVSESVLKSMQSSSMKGNPVGLTVEELEMMLRNAM